MLPNDHGRSTGKALNEHLFYRFAPQIGHPIGASTSTNYLSIGFAKHLRGHGPQQSTRSMRIISSEAGLSGIPMPPMVPDERALAKILTLPEKAFCRQRRGM